MAQLSGKLVSPYSVIPPKNSAHFVGQVDTIERKEEAHMDNVAPIESTRKHIQFSEAITRYLLLNGRHWAREMSVRLD